MRINAVTVLQKGNQVGNFMNQGDQKSIFIQASVYTVPVIVPAGGMTVIAQDTLAGAGNREMDMIMVQVPKNFFGTSCRQIMIQILQGCFLFRLLYFYGVSSVSLPNALL